MDSTEKAIVLKVGRFREHDAWVRLLTPSRGLFTAFAFGGCRSRRRFCGCLDALSLVLFTLSPSRRGAYITLQEGSLIHAFRGLRGDSQKLGLAVNCMKFLEAAQVGSQGSKAAYELLLETLYAIESMERSLDFLPLFFRAKTAFEQGWLPQFMTCHRCGMDLNEIDEAAFLVEKGRASCTACRLGQGFAVAASADTLRTLDLVARVRPSGWAALALPPRVRRQCYEIIEHFVAYHLGIAWDNGRFRKV